VLVTGGATGIGKECSVRFAEAGFDVGVNYSRSQDDAKATIDQIRAGGGNAVAIQANVADDDSVRSMIDQVEHEFGRLDVLVNSAGVTRFVDAVDLDGLTEADWHHVMDVNVRGLFQCTRAAAHLLRTTNGAVVNIGSTAGIVARGSSIAYAASKAAAHSVSQALARVLAPDVRVNTVAPGIVDTRWVSGREDHVQRLSATTPLQRVCTPEEVAAVVFFLATEASFMTGQTVVVDGGMFS
jgi:3-oxoacyl-[acyl-carrier protein] reductase